MGIVTHSPGDCGWIIRPACIRDSRGVGAVYASSFAGLFRATFGAAEGDAAELLGDLYEAGILPLAGVSIAEKDGIIAGFIAVRNMESPSHPGLFKFWRALRRRMNGIRAARAFLGSVLMEIVFDARVPPARVAYIETLAVRDEFRRVGIGRGLVEHAISEFEQRGFPTASLHVLARNSGAISLYETCGFRQASEPRFAPRLMNRVLPRKPVYYMERDLRTARPDAESGGV